MVFKWLHATLCAVYLNWHLFPTQILVSYDWASNLKTTFITVNIPGTLLRAHAAVHSCSCFTLDVAATKTSYYSCT